MVSSGIQMMTEFTVALFTISCPDSVGIKNQFQKSKSETPPEFVFKWFIFANISETDAEFFTFFVKWDFFDVCWGLENFSEVEFLDVVIKILFDF